MSCATITNVFSEAIAAAIPQAELSISQWAAVYRFLAPERSARPGRWRNEVVPYLAEIMDTVRQPGVRETVFVASAQVGKSECCNNVIGYFIHIEPCPILYLAEEEGKAQAWSKESFAPMIRETPVLKELIGDVRTRDSGNTIEDKSFPGGHIAIGWATSPATVSSRPRRVVLLDERDAYKPTKEGDPAALAEERTNTFEDAAVLVKVSTPRDRLENPPDSPPDAPRYSPIELEYENSDKRRYHVPCPHCGEYQPLTWRNAQGDFNIRWDEGDVDNAYYVCVNGCVIEHDSKADMLARGRWVAEKPFTGRAGFHLWAGYSPFVSWGKLARKFLDAKNNPSKLKVFVNTSLAEGWEDTAQASVEDLEGRERFDDDLLPSGVLVITAGVDTQGNRLEAEKVGWGLDDETWSIDYRVFYGDPSQQAVWDELQEWLTEEHEYEVKITLDGGRTATVRQPLRVAAACVDSGGHHTEEVYAFTRKHVGRKFHAVKGANTPGKPLVSKPSLLKKPGGTVRLYTVGTETAKDTIAARLAVEEPGPGYCHFPPEREGTDGRVYYGEAHFKQLRSERSTVRGGVRRWEKIRPSARNEALDVRVYATAARTILNPNYRRIARRRAAAAAQLARSGQAQVQVQALALASDGDAFEAAAEAAAEVPTSAHVEPGPEPEPAEPERPRRRKTRRRGGRNYATSWKEY